MITFEALQERSSRHYRAVHIENREGLKDPSCVICYLPGEISEEFDKFLNWYGTKVPAATYSEYTLRIIMTALANLNAAVTQAKLLETGMQNCRIISNGKYRTNSIQKRKRGCSKE